MLLPHIIRSSLVPLSRHAGRLAGDHLIRGSCIRASAADWGCVLGVWMAVIQLSPGQHQAGQRKQTTKQPQASLGPVSPHCDVESWLAPRPDRGDSDPPLSIPSRHTGSASRRASTDRELACPRRARPKRWSFFGTRLSACGPVSPAHMGRRRAGGSAAESRANFRPGLATGYLVRLVSMWVRLVCKRRESPAWCGGSVDMVASCPLGTDESCPLVFPHIDRTTQNEDGFDGPCGVRGAWHWAAYSNEEFDRGRLCFDYKRSASIPDVVLPSLSPPHPDIPHSGLIT